MQKAIAFFLLSLLLLQHSGRLVVLAWYELNHPYIVRNLCENRARPQLHCDGKCILAKKLKAAEEREKQQTSQLRQWLETPVFTSPTLPEFVFETVWSEPEPTPRPAYHLPGYASPSSRFFHPPCV